MKTLHACLMGTFAVALLAVGAGFLIPGGHAAIAQHGHAEQAEAQAHFDAMVKELGLSDEQRAAVAPHFGRAYGLMLEMHQLHEAMAAEMTEEQRAAFTAMMHERLCGGMGHAQNGDGGHQSGHQESH